jgi:hypothetical protein
MLTMVSIENQENLSAGIDCVPGSITDEIQFLSADGLGPVKADLANTSYANVDGVLTTGKSVGARNIVFTFGLNPKPPNTVQYIRSWVYNACSPKSLVRISFTTTSVPVYIYGIVESCEPVLFSKNPEVQVSILCPDPYFKALFSQTLTGSLGAWKTFSYYGTAPAGFVLEVERSAESYSDLTFYNQIGYNVWGETITYQFRAVASGLPPSVKYVLNTKNGEKSFTLYDGTNLMRAVAGGSKWFKLYPGQNKIFVAGYGGGSAWTLRWTDLYTGL